MCTSISSMNRTWPNFETATFQPKEILADIAVVIPTLGRPILAECLYWMATAEAWPAELWIIDQGGNPAVSGWIQKLQNSGLNASYIYSPKRGRSAGINTGLERVTTRFVAVTDDDCFVYPDWLWRMVEALGESPESIITGRVDPASDDEAEFCVVTSPDPQVYFRPQLKVHPLIGGNMGVAMQSAKRIGGFDEHPSIHSAEDSDWGYRALKLGIPIIYNPEIALRHYNWRDENQRAARYADYARSQGAFYGKYLLSGDLLISAQVGRSLLRAPIRWLRGLLKHDQDMIDRGRTDMLYLLPGILSGIRRRSS